MNLFLLFTAMLSALAGIGRPPVARVSAAVEASRAVVVARSVAPAIRKAAADRPDGYVARDPLPLDLGVALGIVRSVVPERRRE